MSLEYNRAYAPILRSPLLFHPTPVQSTPNYYPTQPSSAPSNPRVNFSNTATAQYTLRPQYTTQAPLPIYPHSYPYYPTFPLSTVPSQIPISAYSIPPNFTYSTTVSSKGLTFILIATLILVALDLVIVRPQKLNTLEVRDSKTEISYVSY